MQEQGLQIFIFILVVALILNLNFGQILIFKK